ncbi:MAG: CHRD domain-containing protein [Luteitalea sp.]|nr:CHRD domain-containing protein [Luteitalea sp.]
MTLVTLLLTVRVISQDTPPLEDPIPEPIRTGHVTISLTPVAEGLTAPNWGTVAPGCAELRGRLYVTDQDGILWGVELATGEKRVILDVSAMLVSLGVGGPGSFDERGFLGVAFHPDYAENGLLYTYTSEPATDPADFSTLPEDVAANHQSLVREWQIPDPCNPDSVVDASGSRELLRVDEPQFNHDAGALTFGPDGYLYVAFGDGGAADDEGDGHVEGGNGQDPSNILGTIIRIDPTGSNAANGQYGIPADNPFVGVEGFLDEIHAYGFRNPFRFSFDSQSGAMYIGDVGQNDIEEIDIGVAGGNFGWRIKEGSFCFDPNGTEPGFVFDCQPGDEPEGLIDPIAEYDHDEGIAVIGGFVYHGNQIPALKGRYVFGDNAHPAGGGGRLFFLQKNGPLHKKNRVREFRLAGMETLGLSLLGFGQDARGELYLLANQEGVPFGETGVVLQLTKTTARRSFWAHLTGASEVPPVETRARGQALFRFNRDRPALDFTVVVGRIADVVASHIHCGPEGVNGPVGVTLFSGDPRDVNGILVRSSASSPDESNGCGWETLEDVETAILRGNAYVNVHTQVNPGGEIRGQVR